MFVALATLGLLLSSAGGSTGAEIRPIPPADAIALADRHGVGRSVTDGVKGRFEIVVQRTERTPRATFLNSMPDYRAPGNVSFAIRPIVAAMLKKRYGVAPEVYLKGRRVVVDGIITKNVIVNVVAGRAHSFNRFSYTVQIERAAQIVSVE